MNLDSGLDDLQASLLQVVRDFHAAPARPPVRSLFDQPRGYDESAWREWSSMEWLGLTVPDAAGGVGLGSRELALLAREAGQALAPTPFVFAVIANAFLAACGSGAAGGAGPDISALIAGRERATIAVAGTPAHPLRVEGDLVTGTALAVPYPDGSAWVVVLTDDDLARLVRLDPEQQWVPRSTDPTRRMADVRLDGVASIDLKATGDMVRRLRLLGTLAIAADSVGVAARGLDFSVEHARTRTQFGRPIGTFQGVSHRCAQLAFELQSAWTLIWLAAAAIDDPARRDDADLLTWMAKEHASSAGVSIANSTLQVHGGSGFAADNDSHLLLRRAMENAQLWTSAEDYRERVAGRILGSTDGESRA